MQNSSFKTVKPVDKPQHISLLIPTRARPDYLDRMFESIDHTVGDADGIDVWIYVDNDDAITKGYINSESYHKYSFKINWVLGERTASQGRMVDALREKCTTNPGIYLPWGDDYIFISDNWDGAIRDTFSRYPDGIVMGYIRDPIMGSDQVTLPVLSARWTNVTGRLLTEFFPCWHDDTWLDQVSQMVQRKVRIDIDAGPIGGKGKTPRLKNLWFWNRFFNNLMDERIEDANLLLKAMYPENSPEYQKSLQEAQRLVKAFVEEREKRTKDDALACERACSSFPEKPGPHLITLYLILEAKAVSRLCSKADSLMQCSNFGKALKMLDNVLLAEQKYKNINYLRAVCLKHLGREREATGAAMEELKLQPQHKPSQEISEDCKGQLYHLFSLGVKRLRQGQPSEALVYFDQVKHFCPELSNLQFARATALAQLGDLYPARDAAGAELSLQPEHNGARRLLEAIVQGINEYEQGKNKPGKVVPAGPQPGSEQIKVDMAVECLVSAPGASPAPEVVRCQSGLPAELGNNEQEMNIDEPLAESELNALIPPEIKDDEFYFIIQKLAKEADIKTILEIGSSGGAGSTEAFVTGLHQNPNNPTLFCMEISKPRFAELQKRYENDPDVKCYNVSSIPPEKFPTEEEVRAFYSNTRTALNNYPIERVLGWLRQDIEYMKNSDVCSDGIQKIKEQNNIENFDMVLIDGSAFAGAAELDVLYGAKFVLLDDINDFKNYRNHHRLLEDPNYRLIKQNFHLRNGYSVFKRVEFDNARIVSDQNNQLRHAALFGSSEVNMSNGGDFSEQHRPYKIVKAQPIPIMFVHIGDQEFLKYSLAQAKLSNPGSKIYLIGDTSNDRYDFLEHHNIKNYSTKAEVFSNLYKHLSTNGYNAELVCFLRWFILRDFLEAMQIEKCLYLDSDVMLYADLREEQDKFSQYDLTVSQTMAPHCNYINGLKGLNDFCNLLLESYSNPSLLGKLEDIFQSRSAEGLPGGVCDMTLFYQYQLRYPNEVGEISPVMGQSKYDHDINMSEDFEMEGGIKKIFWLNNKPYGRHIGSASPIRFNTLHFQGKAKTLLKNYFTGELHFSARTKKWLIKKQQEKLPSVSHSNAALASEKNLQQYQPSPTKTGSKPLPIHFFTIVLNGQPFIRHHIEVFKQLPFNWHWHIVEGVADLKHDTSWSLELGGRITEELHRNGHSNDGTKEYLDELARQFPDNITIYRKPGGAFWDGKLEMVNAPLANIRKQCLLWQVDADELWTVEQICRARDMFIAEPDRTAAYYLNHFFVAQNLVTTTIDTYGNNTAYEWLRTWRFKPGYRWTAHEPPRLCMPLQDDQWADIATMKPFRHSETRAKGMVFQHYAYVTKEQVRFKEIYYGYKNAILQWLRLQGRNNFPVFLRDYFAWVKDGAQVNTVQSRNITPLAWKDTNDQWCFCQHESPSSKEQAVTDDGSGIGNVLTVSVLPQVLSKPPVTDSDRKNILVVSHERSGTHFLVNAIAFNFPHYSNRVMSVMGGSEDLAKIFSAYYARSEKRIFKSHHQFDFFEPFFDELIQHFHIFYVVRDGRDVLTSCFHYFNKAPAHEFPRTQNITDLLMTKPSAFSFDREYSFRQASNMIERWCTHIESWLAVKDKITIFKYEDLKHNFENTIAHVASVLGLEVPTQFTVPTISDTGISNRKGITGDWKNHFSEVDLAAFNSIASECMRKLGYYDLDSSAAAIAQKNNLGQSNFRQAELSRSGQKNILWVRPDSIGDNVLAASMLPYIREKFRDARITVVCQEHIAQLYQPCPFVDDVVAFNRKRMSEDEQYRNEIVKRLQALKPELSLNSVFSRDALTDVLAIEPGAGERIALEGNLSNISAEQRHKHNQFYSRLLPSEGGHKLELERHRDFLRGLGIDAPPLEPMIWTTVEDEKFADDFFLKHNLKPEKTVGLFCGAQHEVRLYEKYGQAMSGFCKDNHLKVVALGTRQEWDINQRNLDAIGAEAVNLSGKVTLNQASAILKRCRLAVGAETGLAHISCAVGTPNVILLGGGHFGRFMPYSPLTSIVSLPLECCGCNWRYRCQRTHCVRDVEPEVIAEALQQVFVKPSGKPRVFVQGDSLWQPKPGQPIWKSFEDLLDVSKVEIIPVGQIPEGTCEGWQGRRLLSKGDIEGALNAFTRAAEIAPNSIIARNNIGRLHLLKGRVSDALEHFLRALEIDPCDRTTILNCGQLLADHGKIEDVRKLYVSYLQENPDDSEITQALEGLDGSKAVEVRESVVSGHKSGLIAAPASVGFEQSQAQDEESKYLVTAIVSTYNSERFIRGCLDDLIGQGLFKKGQLEIVVVNSGSQQNEEAIVEEFQQKYDNIKYIKTEERETVYQAWNRGIKVASGKYITNANTDDRHRQDALQVMADTLLANPDIALVYGDQIRTDTPNDTFAGHHATEMTRKPDYNRERLLFGCCVGSQPMWRKSLHSEFGYFDDTLSCAGDWDFWLRVSSKYNLKRIPEFLGLYYYNENGIEHRRKIHSLYERYIVGKRYGNPYISVIPLYHNKSNPLVSVIMPAYNAADYIAEAIESVLIQNYSNFELIIVDDGSTDGTKDIIAGFKDDKIKYFYKENAGAASARNFAIKQAKGQFIMPLDSDDMVTPDFIAEHLEQFEKHPEADLVYCDDCLIDDNGEPLRVIKRPEYTDRKSLIRDLFRCGFPAVPFRTCVKRAVFDKIGFYDEQLVVGEDYDMMRRFVKNGLKIHHLKGEMYLRRMTSDGLSRDYTAQKAKCHFEVVRRFADTFAYDELFPDVAWDKIPLKNRKLHAKCLAAVTFLTIGQSYVETNAPDYAKTAFGQACSELNDCLRMDPGNQRVRQLLQKCEFARAEYAGTAKESVCRPM